ncbi:MAG: PorP/SprF family type IX secretion system membrane protein [Bacteroidales bacterium]|nr:PorP/SprF family type IX secretion system membrane protein [Bacteroidales bacterium]
MPLSIHIARPLRTGTICRTVALCMLAMGASKLPAQDIHFSQIDINPVLYNPAYCGFFDGDGRFGAIYRNQWATVSTPFQTIAATAELPIVHGKGYTSGLNGGAILSADRAGTLGYGTTALQGIVSYFLSLSGHNDNMLSFAVQGGLCQSGFDDTDIELTDGAENFDRTRVVYPTIGAGVAWFKQIGTSASLKVGVAALNLNQPHTSYLNNELTMLSRRFNAYVRGEYEAWSSISLMPVVGYQHQGQYNELVYGIDVRWYLNESARNYLALTGGITMRHSDAAVITFAVERGPFTFALSYDANTSRLAQASHTIGSFEVGVIYRIIKPQARYRQLPCPII